MPHLPARALIPLAAVVLLLPALAAADGEATRARDEGAATQFARLRALQRVVTTASPFDARDVGAVAAPIRREIGRLAKSPRAQAEVELAFDGTELLRLETGEPADGYVLSTDHGSPSRSVRLMVGDETVLALRETKNVGARRFALVRAVPGEPRSRLRSTQVGRGAYLVEDGRTAVGLVSTHTGRMLPLDRHSAEKVRDAVWDNDLTVLEEQPELEQALRKQGVRVVRQRDGKVKLHFAGTRGRRAEHSYRPLSPADRAAGRPGAMGTMAPRGRGR